MLLSGSVLLVGGVESFQSEKWVTTTVQKAWIASVQKKKYLLMQRCLYFTIIHAMKPTIHAHHRPPSAPPGILWFSAKSIQCCIVQVLHSTLKQHAYRKTVGSTLLYSTILICAVFSVCRQQDRPIPGLCLRHHWCHFIQRLILQCISLKCTHFQGLV